ncbi:MAG TPA: cation-transporting P-type ATPase [Gaiellaceae bacterium]|nr:cation-transporting P-type ATPase [Gaiellaceae bacterium]
MQARPPPGLTTAEAARRFLQHGPNALAEPPRPSRLHRLGRNLVHLFALLLWTGAGLALLAGLPELAVAIVVVVLVNAAFATGQELRAERATEALRRMLPQQARVRRDGVEQEVAAAELVPGDVLVLRPGDRVSADGELLDETELRVDESTLTGESWPVAPHGVVHAGTWVTGGVGEAVVTATGMNTEFGRIAALTQAGDLERSPLERELDRLTRFVALLVLGLGTAFFLTAGALGMGLRDRFVFAIGVMVANVPEGLLPTVTLSLALATQRMARRNALVRRLSAVETLGETTVICTDKTGTLTKNELTAQEIWTPALSVEVEGTGYSPHGRFRRDGEVVHPSELDEVLRAGLLCNDTKLEPGAEGWRVVGDPTEAALITLAAKGGLHHPTEAGLAPRLAELPFDSTRMRMTTVHATPAGRVAYVKGAPEAVLARTRGDEASRARALREARELEGSGLRVLALARRAVDAATPLTVDALEQDLELLGLVGMLDPPRPEIAGAIERCRRAGIRIVMVTGDSGPTARAVARRIGLVDDACSVVEGSELDGLADDELVRLVLHGNVVFARTAPEGKLRLARALRAHGEVVAMTGDGVNDAPALREADIGVAMGIAGTDVARETADLVLVDDDFSSIVAAVEEGRAVYANIRRFAAYHFCSNVGELVPFLVWGLSGGAVPLPLVVMQVLAIDLGTDMLPAIALGTERAEPGTMERPPRRRTERLLNRATVARVYGYVGPIEGLAAMTSFLWAYWLAGWRPGDVLADAGPLYVQATGMTCLGVVAAQVGAGLAMRTDRRSVFSVGLLSNRFLLAGIAVEAALAVALVEVPVLQELFHTRPLGWEHWALLAVWPPVVLAAEEARKAVVRRRSHDVGVEGAQPRSPTAPPLRRRYGARIAEPPDARRPRGGDALDVPSKGGSP